MERRQFIVTLVTNFAASRLAVVAGVGGSVVDCASSAARPRSAGTERLDRIGLQLYTVRDALAKDFEGTLARVAATGYREVEFAGYMGRRPEEVRAVLERNGLRAPSAHVALEEMRAHMPAVVDAAHTIGHDYIVVPYLPDQERRTMAQYERLADELNTLGRAARDADLRLGYHNHDFEFTTGARAAGGEGRLPYDLLLERTDPQLVSFEMDLYWITKAGYDPLAYFARFPGRFRMVHVKDSTGAPEHRMAPVGAGTIDFRRIFAQRKQAGIEHAFVEHDNPTDAFASIATSYANLSKMTF